MEPIKFFKKMILIFCLIGTHSLISSCAMNQAQTTPVNAKGYGGGEGGGGHGGGGGAGGH